MILKNLRKYLKSNKLIYSVYTKCKRTLFSSNVSYEIPEIEAINPRIIHCEYNNPRINILLPSLNRQHVFGGIATALKFFEDLGNDTNLDMRIILTDSDIEEKNYIGLNGYSIISAREEVYDKKQIVSFANRYKETIPVAPNDIFIATGWWTAYAITDVIEWQARTYNKKLGQLIYFIQDYEPGFYPWSSRYLMSENTYCLDIPTVAIFNSKLLQDFFTNNGYKFYKQYFFEPILNRQLKEYLLCRMNKVERKNQIIVYGRPTVQRNAFELIILALKQWATTLSNSEEWKVYSVGEEHADIMLGENLRLVSLGKLTLEQYARTMLQTKIAISLMVSPHPSYPPLEMATFGIKTITNEYHNKDLGSFNDNIISLKNCSPRAISQQLVQLCNDPYLKNDVILNEQYLGADNGIEEIIKQLSKDILEYDRTTL